MMGTSLGINSISAQGDYLCLRAGMIFKGCYLQGCVLEAGLWRLASGYFSRQISRNVDFGSRAMESLGHPSTPAPRVCIRSRKSECLFQDPVMCSQEKCQAVFSRILSSLLFQRTSLILTVMCCVSEPHAGGASGLRLGGWEGRG